MSIIVAVVVIGLFLIGGRLFIGWADRRRVIRYIGQRGGTVLSIERFVPVRSGILSERNTTFWRIRYRAADGSVRVAECFASFLRCKIYQDNEDAASSRTDGLD